MSGDVRNYRIEFHQLSFKATDQLANLGDAFQSVIDKQSPSSSNHEGFTREIWGLKKRADGSFSGELRKFRNSNIPDKGAPGNSLPLFHLPRMKGSLSAISLYSILESML